MDGGYRRFVGDGNLATGTRVTPPMGINSMGAHKRHCGTGVGLES